MLKQELEFEDPFSDENPKPKLKELFYFNITEPEIAELMFEPDQGLEGYLKQITEEEDIRRTLEYFKKLILLAIGERDGVHHIKDDGRVARRFAQHPAFPVLYMRMLEDAEFAADFIMGIFPKELVEAYKQATEGPKRDQDKPDPSRRPTPAGAQQLPPPPAQS